MRVTWSWEVVMTEDMYAEMKRRSEDKSGLTVLICHSLVWVSTSTGLSEPQFSHL